MNLPPEFFNEYFASSLSSKIFLFCCPAIAVLIEFVAGQQHLNSTMPNQLATPLTYAIENHFNAIYVQFLLECGATQELDLTKKDNHLRLALSRNLPDHARYLLNHYPGDSLIRQKEHLLDLFDLITIDTGYLLSTFLTKGIEVNQRYQHGRTLLIQQCMKNYSRNVSSLLYLGANHTIKDEYGYNALHAFIRMSSSTVNEDDIGLINCLVGNDCENNKRLNGDSVLMDAVRYSTATVITQLFNAVKLMSNDRVRIDVGYRNKNTEKTALSVAMEIGDEEKISLLENEIQRQANKPITYDPGFFPIPTDAQQNVASSSSCNSANRNRSRG